MQIPGIQVTNLLEICAIFGENGRVIQTDKSAGHHNIAEKIQRIQEHNDIIGNDKGNMLSRKRPPHLIASPSICSRKVHAPGLRLMKRLVFPLKRLERRGSCGHLCSRVGEVKIAVGVVVMFRS